MNHRSAKSWISNGLAAAALCAAALTGCSAKSAGSSEGIYGASTSELAVRGFLDGANAEDYTRMMNLFGTDKGAAVKDFGVTNVEQRMIFLSGVLKHQDYELEQANLAQLGPDRVRWVARMTGTRKGAVSIPVVTVHDGSGRWFVERLNLDELTASVTG